MKTSTSEFEKWLNSKESDNLEFKAARSSFDSREELPKYCAGLANAGGGKLILGVDDNHNIVGSEAFRNTLQNLPQELYQQLTLNVEVEEILHPQGRIVIFHIPGRRAGLPIRFNGRYLTRRGSSLVEMDELTLKEVFKENEPDFSQGIVEGLKYEDLDPKALLELRAKWAYKAKRPEFENIELPQVLRDLELVTQKGITYAALILVGSTSAIREHLPDAEIIFEWRHNKEQIHYDARKTWRYPYILAGDEVAKEIELRNWRVPMQEGLFQRDLYAYDDKSVREAINNAVAHRDYSLRGRSVFIKLSTEEFFIESPGGFPVGVTRESILDQTAPRNRLLAETLNRVGLVERSGQGLNDIFKRNILLSKEVPDIWEVDKYWVCLKIPALIRDVEFVGFIEKVSNENNLSLSLPELMELETIRSRGCLVELIKNKRLIDYGLVEKVRVGRVSQYVLAHRYYVASDKAGKYTRLVGLSRAQKKQLIVNHLAKNAKCSTKDIASVFTELKAKDVSNLLQELKREGEISFFGNPRSGYWSLAKSS